MDTTTRRGTTRGFSFIEILIAIAIIALLAGLLLPALARSKSKAIQTQCRSNMRQVGTGFRLWGDDNNDSYPMRVPMSKGGAEEAVLRGDVFRAFQCMSNELSTPKILTCPADQRPPAANFIDLQNINVSYFVGVDADEANPRLFLTGDRNVTVNGTPAGSGLVSIKTPATLGWTGQTHQGSGNVCLADGSVQMFTATTLQNEFQNSRTNMQRLAFP